MTSQEIRHSDVAYALYRALASGDRQTILASLAPDFIGHTTAGLPLALGGTYRGPGEMLRDFWGRIAKHYAASAEPVSVCDLTDGRLMVHGFYRGKARVSGGELVAEFVHVLTFNEARITELIQITDSVPWHRALESRPPTRKSESS